MLATKAGFHDLDASAVCYALICKYALFSIDDIATTLPLAVTDMLQAYVHVFPHELITDAHVFPHELSPRRY